MPQVKPGDMVEIIENEYFNSGYELLKVIHISRKEPKIGISLDKSAIVYINSKLVIKAFNPLKPTNNE